MNKKGFTLIELIAVVVIMAIIALIATPNIVSMMDKGKKEDYVADAKEIISKATYMYKKEKTSSTKNFSQSDGGNGNTLYWISLEKIEGINDYKDPYGFDYDKGKSTVTFVEPGSTSGGTLQEREVKIVLMSMSSDGEDCYILDADKDKIDVNAVKQGKISGDNCQPSQ